MNKIISAESEKAAIEMETAQTAARYPLSSQPKVRKAFAEAEHEEFESAAALCRELLEEAAVPEIRMLLGTCQFRMGDMVSAEEVFAGLVQDYPEESDYRIYHGMTYHALGRFEEAIAELKDLYPLENYQPFYYTSYGDSLQQTGKLKQSREAFYKEVECFKKMGIIASAEMVDGAFQNLLYLDIILGNGKYQEDIRIYYDFLDQVDMDETMQEYLAGNIVYFCSLMKNKWYRPLFLEFITHIRNRGFLKASRAAEVLESAFASWESFQYHEDGKVTSMMEQYLCASYERKYGMQELLSETEKKRITVTALTYDWYLCQYAPEHPEEIQYVQEQYPYTYADNRTFFEKMLADPEGMTEKAWKELYPYAGSASEKEFEDSLRRAYRKACETEKEPVFVYDGMDSYRRIQPKVGRNEPCPCGSGKKYKKCCGK